MNKVLIDIRNEGIEEVFGCDTVTVEELINAVKDLKCELETQEEHYEDKIEELEREHEEMIHDFYKEKSPYEVYGLNEADFH
jgi:hypothetical protein